MVNFNLFKKFKRPILFFLSSQNDGSNWYRCYLPSLRIKKFKVGRSVDDFNSIDVRLKKDKKTIKALTNSDIIVVQRMCSDSLFFFLDGLKKIKPRKIVFECDDLVDKIYKTNLGSLFWDEDRIKQLDYLLSRVDLITTTTNYLREKWQKKNQNIIVLPNSIDFDFIPKIQKDYTKKERLKILISGSCLYPENIDRSLLEIFKEIAKRHNLILFGIPIIDEKSWEIMYKENRKMYYQFKEFLKPLNELEKKFNVELINNVVFGSYYDDLRIIDADVALIPRGKHEFNKAKSNLKILEMSAFKIPCIVSPMEEYKEFIEKGLVLGARGSEDWLEQIKKLENPELRKEMAEKCYQYVFENYNMAKNYKLWEDAYLSLF